MLRNNKSRKLIFIGAITALSVVGLSACGDDNSDNSTATTITTPTTAKGNSKVTLDEYNKIENGMTYQQVVDIIGGKEQSTSSLDIGGQTLDTLTWNGDGLGDIVTIQFNGGKETGKVSSKAQVGLG